MGILKRSADLVYAFRMIKLLSMKWEDFDAYKLGIIDENGKRQRDIKLDTPEKKDAYTPFIRMAVNLKRITRGNRLIGFASGLFLIREQLNLSDKSVRKLISECGLSPEDILTESTNWFMADETNIIPGVYKLTNEKMLNGVLENLAFKGDKIRIVSESPVGEILGTHIYEAVHLRSNQWVYVTTGELIK